MGTKRRQKAYDYVIVGAGSAGCVLANRLSAEASVLLLEAGPRDRHWRIHLPPGFVKLFKTRLDWAYHTEPEPHLHGRRLYWPRGRMLGGSSSLNAMLYVRGHPSDYDRWRELGNEGWGFEDVLPYFRRAERQARGADAYHGADGPLPVTDPLDPNRLSRVFVEAGMELGWPANPDFNGARQEGVGLYQVTQVRGRRMSTATAYLRPARGRPTLEVVTGAPVARVLFEGRRAVGVELLRGGRREVVRAEREVILSGGAIGSPQLLLASGVGPAEELRRLGIEVILDSPGVGRNLQDHPVVSVVFRCRQPITLDGVDSLPRLLPSLGRYLLKRRGPLTTTVCEGGAFVRTRPELSRPDLQFHFLPAALVDHGFDQAADQGFNFGPTLLRPQSRGTVSLRSADPLEPPAIRANYLAEPSDLDHLVEGVKLARRLGTSRAFAPYMDREVVPGPEARTDAELTRFVRRTLATIYHPVGTCRMGPANGSGNGDEPTAVVDSRLAVHGLEGLRVVDASVMPEIIGGNTNAPTIMIAEKAADLILGG